jgi:ornithine cyclodeaminase/alanine dehydrogenase-like protein (mu-crystallin family)
MTQPATTFFDSAQVRAAVSMPAAIDAVRDAFVSFAAGDFELPLRTSMREGGFLTMNAHHASSGTAVVKSLSLDFTRRPAVAGVVSFLSQGEGPSAVMDAAAVTTIRTGAVVGAATDLLAPQDASRVTLIGLGGQAPDQLRAVRAVRPVRSLRLAGISLAEAESFRDRMAAELDGLDVECFADVDEAVSDTDIICCATTATVPLFAESSLPARVHVNAIGAFRLSMRELPDELLGSATVVVDQREAALEEAGDVVHAIEAGLLDADALLELGAVLPTGVPATDRTVFKSVGLAIQDWAVARLVAETARG